MKLNTFPRGANSKYLVSGADPVESEDDAEQAKSPDSPVGESISEASEISSGSRRARLRKLGTRVGIPALIACLSAGTGYVTWQNIQQQRDVAAASESVRAATDTTVALLTYKPDTVDKDLEAARNRLTGQFLDSYTTLTRDVVIPGAQQKKIAATATVPAAAPVSASDSHAVVLVFVNQTVTVGADAPTSSTSSVRVSLDRVDSQWLVSGFDPI
ncbi:hypothetical protein V4U86_21765 [Mycobacterium sp. AMU20-3851]|uniref:hypothetical protein n=1 Tax=Mycobacterium sp. AMU20-3851 TaxID=3122055 RepID=UPI003754DF7A